MKVWILRTAHNGVPGQIVTVMEEVIHWDHVQNCGCYTNQFHDWQVTRHDEILFPTEQYCKNERGEWYLSMHEVKER